MNSAAFQSADFFSGGAMDGFKSSSFLAAIAIIGVVSIGPALAESCSGQAARCGNWARTSPDVPASKRQEAANACRTEIPKCIARCKGGDKTYYGVTGIPHAIQTCS